MDDREQWMLRTLLERQQVMALAVVDDGRPEIGQVPFAFRQDCAAAYIHVSRLARHSRGLGPGAAWSGLVQVPGVEAEEVDPFQHPRLSLHGRAQPLERGSEAWASARDRYLERLPSGAVTFQLGDFTLYELEIERGRFVSGFAGAHTVAPAMLAEILARL